MSEASTADEDEANQLTPWGRLKQVYDLASTPVEPGQEVPPMPPQFQEWAQATCFAVLAGICYQGTRQYIRFQDEGVSSPPTAALSKAQESQRLAAEKTRRLGQLSRQAIKGGLSFGSLTGLFCAIQLGSTVARGEKTIFDTVLAASVSGAALGAIMPGSALRLRSSALTGLLGGAIGFPIGFLQLQLEESLGRSPRQAAKISPVESQEQRFPQLGSNPTKAVIESLESTLK